MFRLPNLGMLLIGLVVAGTGCDQVPTDGDPSDATTPVLHHRPGHAGGGGGTGEDPPGYTLEFSGAVVAAATPVEVERDNKRTLTGSGEMEVSFAFDLTNASCAIGLPDGYGGDAAALEAHFRAILEGDTGSPSTRNVHPFQVRKHDSTGSIRFLPLVELGDDLWVRLGGADVSGDFDGPGDRVLTYTGGSVRIVARLSADSWDVCSSTVACGGGDPGSEYVCADWPGSVVATLRESP